MIPTDFIHDLISRTDIVDVIDEYVPLKKAGQNYSACCPFHKEKTPSFTVSPHKGFYHCFGCGASGSAIDFLMAYAHLSFPEAVEKLATRTGMVVPHVKGSLSPEAKAQYKERKQQQLSLENVMQKCTEFYQNQYAHSQEAQSYLSRRGLSDEVIRHFGLGFAPSGWQSLAQVFDDYPNKLLIQAGMVLEKEGRHYDRFRERIMFPIRNIQGQVIAFGGRILDKGEPKYLNSPETPLFNKGSHLYGLFEAREGIRANNKAIVVEGYMDVVALAQYGIDYAVATLGTATTAEHIKLLFRQSHAVYFCFDGDNAGRRAGWKALENALPYLKDDTALYFLFLPKEHDPDTYVRQYGKAYFETVLERDSLPLSRYWLEHLCEQVRLDTEEGKAELIRTATPQLSAINAPNLKFLLTRSLAQKLGLAPEELSYLIGHSPYQEKKQSYRRGTLPQQSFRQPKIPTLAQRQIKWLLINPAWVKYVKLPDYLPLNDEVSCLVAVAEAIERMGDGQHNIAHILEEIRQTDYANTLNQVMQHSMSEIEHFGTLNADDETMFRDGMAKLVSEVKAQHVRWLSNKMQHQPLSPAEKSLLLQLINSSKSTN